MKSQSLDTQPDPHYICVDEPQIRVSGPQIDHEPRPQDIREPEMASISLVAKGMRRDFEATALVLGPFDAWGARFLGLPFPLVQA